MSLLISICSLASRPIAIQLAWFILKTEIVILIHPTVVLSDILVDTFGPVSLMIFREKISRIFPMKTKSKPERFELHHQKDFDQFLFLYLPEKESKLHTLGRLAS